MGDSVQLTDLDVIARYSIAVRSATADRDELVETLRADLAWLERGRVRSSFRAPEDDEYDEEAEEEERPAPRTRASTGSKRAAPRRATTRRTPR
jgi:hypothetical protein